MVVFIGNLPKTAVEKDLLEIARLESGTPMRIFKKRTLDGEMLRYALVTLANPRKVQRLINRLHGFRWQGHTLSVRLYQQRLAANEQRRVDWRSQAWTDDERRRRERRSLVPQVLRVA